MAYIGESSITGMSANGYTSTDNHRITMYSPLLYTAGSNEEVFRVGYYCGTSAGNSSGVDIAVYNVTSGFSGAPLVGYVNTGQLVANQWNVVNFPSPLALTSGQTYAVARAIRSSTNVSEYRVTDGNTRTYAGTSTGSSAPASTWAGTTADFYRHAFYAETRAASSGLSITSVNTTNTAFSAQTDSAVIGTGLSASVVCTYAGIACTNESASSSTSLKITFPNFFANNIKLGRNYEFKVVG